MSCSGKQVYVVGCDCLINQLIANYLAEKAGVSCIVEAKLSSVPVVCGAGGAKRMILYDCENSREQFEILLTPHAKYLFINDYLVLFNMDNSNGIEHDALKLGVHGFLYKQDRIDTLMRMIQAVFNSELWVSRTVMTKYLPKNDHNIPKTNKDPSCLTRREIEILTSISHGQSNLMIADKLCISPHTVKTHIYHLFKKINVSSRLQASNWATRNL